MYTTIKISAKTKRALDSIKIVDGETYEQVIEDLIEDHLEINKEFKKELEASFKEYKKGGVVSFESIKEKLKK
ncbi:hypothetical protein JXB01_00700 [Candidatus Micrarchaeota archaeon]|nr:hypothetical protein [Candidatus Micrarchaeota archaeon]